MAKVPQDALKLAGFAKDTVKGYRGGEGIMKPISTLDGLIGDVLKSPFRAMGWVGKGAGMASVKTAEAAGHGAVWMVKQPFVGVGKVTMGLGRFAWQHKLATVAVFGTGAAIAVANSLQDQAAAQTQQQLAEQAMGGGQQPAAGPAITPEEYAQLEARMKQGGDQKNGFADAIAAQRQVAATATPETAAAL